MTKTWLSAPYRNANDHKKILFLMYKKILLITGGLGYIGSHAVVAFEQAGYTTVIVDNLVNSSKDTLIGIEKILGYCPDFFECDIRDRLDLEKIFQKYDFS